MNIYPNMAGTICTARNCDEGICRAGFDLLPVMRIIRQKYNEGLLFSLAVTWRTILKIRKFSLYRSEIDVTLVLSPRN